MKVYVVIYDGLVDGYGCILNILGIYNSKEAADDAIKIAKEQLKNTPINDEDLEYFFCIFEIVINKTPDLRYDDTGIYDEIRGGTSIGSYIE